MAVSVICSFRNPCLRNFTAGIGCRVDQDYFGEDISRALPASRVCPQHSDGGLFVWSNIVIVNRRGAVLMRSTIAASRLEVGGSLGLLLHLSPHVCMLCSFVFERNGAMQRLHSSSTNGSGHFRMRHKPYLHDFTCVSTFVFSVGYKTCLAS